MTNAILPIACRVIELPDLGILANSAQLLRQITRQPSRSKEQEATP